jgi:hypothetical protein
MVPASNRLKKNFEKEIIYRDVPVQPGACWF